MPPILVELLAQAQALAMVAGPHAMLVLQAVQTTLLGAVSRVRVRFDLRVALDLDGNAATPDRAFRVSGVSRVPQSAGDVRGVLKLTRFVALDAAEAAQLGT